MNKVMLLGRLGQDPELKYLPNGSACCNFSVATSESWKDKQGNKHSEVEWHKVVVWGAFAESCSKYLNKGSQVLIEGKIKTNKWEDKEGNARFSISVVASKVEFLGAAKDTKPAFAAKSKKSDSQNQKNYLGYDDGYDQSEPEYTMGQDNMDFEPNFAADDIPF